MDYNEAAGLVALPVHPIVGVACCQQLGECNTQQTQRREEASFEYQDEPLLTDENHQRVVSRHQTYPCQHYQEAHPTRRPMSQVQALLARTCKNQKIGKGETNFGRSP
jgi:hypothetical protein